MKSHVFLLLGPSGSGKTTLIERLKQSDSNIFTPIYYTTRKKRDYEIGGIHYYFISKSDFISLKNRNEFSFVYTCHGNDYGIPKSIYEESGKGKAILLGVSRKLIPEIKKQFDQVHLIYINTPISNLEERIINRSQTTEKDLAIRLDNAKDVSIWSQAFCDFDLVVNNDGNNSLDSIQNDIIMYIRGVIGD